MLISADINSLYSLRSPKYRCGSFQSQVEPQKTPPAMAPIGGMPATGECCLPFFFRPQARWEGWHHQPWASGPRCSRFNPPQESGSPLQDRFTPKTQESTLFILNTIKMTVIPSQEPAFFSKTIILSFRFQTPWRNYGSIISDPCLHFKLRGEIMDMFVLVKS